MKENNISEERAAMPSGTHVVLDRRTLENSNKNLLKWLKPGMAVLDVGCGTGAITKGIAEKTGLKGKVAGIDVSEELITKAKLNFGHLENLSFEVANILSYTPNQKFDLITSARTLQWMAAPDKALEQMKKLLNPGGIISILDYNHEKINWQPEPPKTMRRFYNAFLQWRKEAGFDNTIADHLKQLMNQIGLKDIEISQQHELSLNGDSNFSHQAGIWLEVARLRGPQLVQSGYISEEDRLAAIEEYEHWINSNGQSMQLYLLAVEGHI
ncbi:class I SAM-dependent methyltransferase [Rhodocytophaga rosea]|uniref:Class I SAM-dependent methyltransferase n=1 Tax=Rhodocytophaga rosea TaxID=2704465 RepID=A0A6C0GUV8_9BACT|nr:class I SAM-dependent methyltransferase [Rhodocytophaga rosea]QHT71594.1 class I SAM-dependent methyltransferase [Rhodocytophaga rosea]